MQPFTLSKLKNVPSACFLRLIGGLKNSLANTNCIPCLVKPMFDPLPLTQVCLHPLVCVLHALSRWPFSPHLLLCAVSFLLQSLAKCSGIKHTKQFPFLGPFLKSRFTASATEHFIPCVSVLCSHGSSAAFSSSLWISLPAWSVLYNKTFIPHWQTFEDQSIEDGLWDCFPCFL